MNNLKETVDILLRGNRFKIKVIAEDVIVLQVIVKEKQINHKDFQTKNLWKAV